LDFILHGMTTEELDWLQSGVYIPSVGQPRSKLQKTRRSSRHRRETGIHCMQQKKARQYKTPFASWKRPIVNKFKAKTTETIGINVAMYHFRNIEIVHKSTASAMVGIKHDRPIGPPTINYIAERNFRKTRGRASGQKISSCPSTNTSSKHNSAVPQVSRKKANQEMHAKNGNTAASSHVVTPAGDFEALSIHSQASDSEEIIFPSRDLGFITWHQEESGARTPASQDWRTYQDWLEDVFADNASTPSSQEMQIMAQHADDDGFTTWHREENGARTPTTEDFLEYQVWLTDIFQEMLF
jgi:hypothetical protein